MINIQEFTLNRGSKINVLLGLIIFYFTLPISMFGLLGSIYFGITAIIFSQPYDKEKLDILLVSLACVILTIVMLQSWINQYNEIRVGPEGISVKVFRFYYRWVFLDWDDIIAVRSVRTPMFDDTIWAIIVRKITPWHGIIGKQYGMSPNALIILQPDLNRLEILLDFLKSHEKSA